MSDQGREGTEGAFMAELDALTNADLDRLFRALSNYHPHSTATEADIKITLQSIRERAQADSRRKYEAYMHIGETGLFDTWRDQCNSSRCGTTKREASSITGIQERMTSDLWHLKGYEQSRQQQLEQTEDPSRASADTIGLALTPDESAPQRVLSDLRCAGPERPNLQTVRDAIQHARDEVVSTDQILKQRAHKQTKERSRAHGVEIRRYLIAWRDSRIKKTAARWAELWDGATSFSVPALTSKPDDECAGTSDVDFANEEDAYADFIVDGEHPAVVGMAIRR